MITRKGLAPHESFELHELITFKNICATKSGTMSKLVNDEDLRSILDDDFRTGQQHIKELRSLMESTNFRA